MKIKNLLLICAALIIITGSAGLAAPKMHTNWWGKSPAQQQMISGTVTSVDTTNIGVQTSSGVKSFAVSSKTKVFIHDQKSAIDNVKVGDPVNIRYAKSDNDTIIAVVIRVPKPNFKGKIESIQSNTITIKNNKGEQTVLVTDQTTYTSHGYKGTYADLKVGYGITAIGDVSGNQITADKVEFRPAVAKGTVTAIDGSIITIKTVKQKTFTVTASSTTVVLVRPRVGPNVKGTLADVKVGSPVNIGFAPGDGSARQLFWIDILTGI